MQEDYWEKAVAFHGHQCGGLAIGYKAALYAIKLLDLTFSKDEEVVCISENNACGVDAIQVILGCSVGKGNLLFHICGKQAFSFYKRSNGKSVRLVLKPRPQDLNREEILNYYLSLAPEDMFDLKETKIILPEAAKLFESHICQGCGEETGANWVHLKGDKKLCSDCYKEYDPFKI
ncbi:MAG: FmdE family protein [Bacillota bacterium]|nr:FmdE family protein [Bacillota bacterium]